MKAVMLSVKPEWCAKIASGEKTIEVRKNKPKLETPFKTFLYCCKPTNYFYHGGIGEPLDDLYRMPDDAHYDAGKIKYGYAGELMCCGADYDRSNFLSGKVIGEFSCDSVFDIYEPYVTWLEKQSCVDMEKIAIYKGDRDVIFGWGIFNLKIYDRPKNPEEFGLQRAPQSWCYVDVPDEEE